MLTMFVQLGCHIQTLRTLMYQYLIQNILMVNNITLEKLPRLH